MEDQELQTLHCALQLRSITGSLVRDLVPARRLAGKKPRYLVAMLFASAVPRTMRLDQRQHDGTPSSAHQSYQGWTMCWPQMRLQRGSIPETLPISTVVRVRPLSSSSWSHSQTARPAFALHPCCQRTPTCFGAKMQLCALKTRNMVFLVAQELFLQCDYSR